MPGKLYLESCCTNLKQIKDACKNGASRIELCERIDLGGITPSMELVKEALSLSTIPINVMIRPRGGDFIYSEKEIEKMAEDILYLKKLSVKRQGFINGNEADCMPVELSKNIVVNGVVFGALTADKSIDTQVVRMLADIASSDCTLKRNPVRLSTKEALWITFHRAFDDAANPHKALEEIIDCGCTHLLTSGNTEDAFKGRFNIARLNEIASGRITIIAGKGIKASNLEQIAKDSKVSQFHGTNLF